MISQGIGEWSCSEKQNIDIFIITADVLWWYFMESPLMADEGDYKELDPTQTNKDYFAGRSVLDIIWSWASLAAKQWMCLHLGTCFVAFCQKWKTIIHQDVMKENL